MGYLDIRSRENIDNIISETLVDYFNTRVTVCKSYKKSAIIFNPRLNIAISKHAKKSIRKLVRRWQSVRTNFLVNIVKQIYITFAFNKLSLLGSKYFVFEDMPSDYKNLIIMPGNMKIKVINYSKMKITNLYKAGFTDFPFRKERKIRINPNWNFILPLEVINSHTYEEELLSGCTFDRVKKESKENYSQKIVNIIKVIQKKDIQIVDSKMYVNNIYVKIQEKLNHLSNVDLNFKLHILRFCKKLINSVDVSKVNIAFSHGDLQYGNIFVTDKGKVYIIDWETYGIRTLYYDLLTYHYKFRYRSNFKLKIDLLLKDNDWLNVLNTYNITPISKEDVLRFFFLEDIEWILDECLQTVDKKASDSLYLYYNKDFEKYVNSKIT